VLARAHGVGKPAEERRRRLPVQRERLGGRNTAAGANLVCDDVDRHQ
jgi:hypothetical protein